ncbi:MAG: hypothetical protein KDA63_00030 [Planctomycetales bacterium]|nr:hypothetical protein [Planctomycetales bacterium]
MSENRNFFVHIIESPSAIDLLDERTEGRLLCEGFRLSGIDSSYNLATNVKTLIMSLGSRLEREKSKFGKTPILHFSLHGDGMSVGLTDGSQVSWSQFAVLLATIRDFLETGILVCISSCFGFAGSDMPNIRGMPPFWAIVGPSGKVDWDDSAIAFMTFYHLFAKGHSLEVAVDAMKRASGNSDFQFKVRTNVQDGWLELQRAFDQADLYQLGQSLSQSYEQRTPPSAS